ncbi:hypothetical protein GBA52_019875 [Prunus armeniaca]|nr:hypothetical protein GBA52_019875 [Prunus armeniaca]
MVKTPEQEHPVEAFGWAARDTTGHLSPFNFSRRATGDEDVRFKVLYCGICHTDLSSIKNEWGICTYPIVPGHELVGEVTEVGSKVKKTKVGDRVGVGGVIGACHDCDNCNNDLEIYCPKMAAMGTFDGIIDTVSAVHAISPLIDLLKSHGKLIMVGAPDKPLELPVYPLLMGRKLVAGSAVGGMKETQEMIDFAAKHNITAEIEVISMDYVNTAMKRLAKNDVRYRFVIDVGNTLAATKP